MKFRRGEIRVLDGGGAVESVRRHGFSSLSLRARAGARVGIAVRPAHERGMIGHRNDYKATLLGLTLAARPMRPTRKS